MPALSVVSAGGVGWTFMPAFCGRKGEGFLQGAVAGDAAGKGDYRCGRTRRAALIVFLTRASMTAAWKGAQMIGEVSLGIVELLELIENGGFEAGEREVKGGVFEVGSGKGRRLLGFLRGRAFRFRGRRGRGA
jgi:hypothetical protein